ncbi:MAG: uroporphyrinogen-III synthase [Planctomycetota bacterium]
MSGAHPLRVLLTRSHDDNRTWAELLRTRGFEPITLGCIQTSPLPEAADALANDLDWCDWLTLSSRRAVRAVEGLFPGELPARIQVACVGPATAAEAKRVFGHVDRVAPDGTGRSLGVELAAALPRSARVLVAAAQEGRVDIEDVLRPAGIDVRRVAVYRTSPMEHGGAPLRLADLALDAVFLASPSAVRGLLNQTSVPGEVAVVALGPTTAEAARRAGLTVHAEAKTRGLDGLVEALGRHLQTKEETE